MDALSDVLQFVRLSGAVYFHGELTAPWGIADESCAELCETFLPAADRIVAFHLITEGSCWARTQADPDSALQVNAGELVVIPQGEPHILCSGFDVEMVSAEPVHAQHIAEKPGEILRLQLGGGGECTRMICGYLACDEMLSNPLILALPKIFKVDLRNDPRSAWIVSSLEFATIEAAEARAGTAHVLGRLSELMFVEAIRRCVDELPGDQAGWLAGVRDRFVGRALSLMHGQPAHAWVVEELAQRVGLSRSALAQRFTDLIGTSPMQYLSRWRLQLAARELGVGKKTLATIAQQVGYESEAAFNRAFKREFGLPPQTWQKQRAAIN